MFPAGREVHQGSRRYSGSKDAGPDTLSDLSTSPATPIDATNAPPPTPADTEPTTMGKILPSWEGDRRFMFPTGKEIHQPARRASQSQGSDQGAAAPVKAAASPPPSSSPKGSGIAAAIAGRRRSSASSQGGGLFSGLMANRGSSEHDQRRQGWEDMKKTDGLSGFFSGLVNKPADKK